MSTGFSGVMRIDAAPNFHSGSAALSGARIESASRRKRFIVDRVCQANTLPEHRPGPEPQTRKNRFAMPPMNRLIVPFWFMPAFWLAAQNPARSPAATAAVDLSGWRADAGSTVREEA